LVVAVSIAFVNRPSATTPQLPRPVHAEPVPPLWKPEPALLLSLSLSPSHRTKIERYDADWRRYRDSVLREVRTMQNGSQVAAGLKGYSELSREYDQTRSAIWQKAVFELNSEQKAKVAAWEKAGGVR
jgi:hypothetical protein